MPTCLIASARLAAFGSATAIWLSPVRWISGSATPSWSMRLRMTSIARSSASGVTGVVFDGLAW